MCPKLPNPLCAADDDGFISFEEFIISYARPKPILKNLLIMAVNTAVIFLIMQAPMLDTMIKVRQWGMGHMAYGCKMQNILARACVPSFETA